MADSIPILMKKASELDLPCRAANCIKNEGVVYIGDLVQKTERQLMLHPNFGHRSLMQIKEKLADMGLHLGMELEDWPPQDINPEHI
jgi:DNA-directed RNA polymerase subunit alpha